MFTVALIFAAVIIAAEFVAILTPLVVYFVTWLIRKFVPDVTGWFIVMFIVPLLSLGLTWVTGLLGNPELTFWGQFAYGLLAVFVNELYKQLKPASTVKK